MVVAVGPGRYDGGVWVETNVKAGDTVMFELSGAAEMESDYMVMHESSIVAVIG
jgi:co-chaperonin GroES (HSP10)